MNLPRTTLAPGALRAGSSRRPSGGILDLRRAIAAFCISLFSLSVEAVSYTVIDIGGLGGDQTDGRGLNAAGWIVGNAISAGRGVAFVWNGNSMQDLGVGDAAAINANGWIVGTNGFPFSDHASIWINGILRDLGTLPGGRFSDATAINSSGTVVGYSTTADERTHAVLWLAGGGGPVDLGTLGTLSTARGINDRGWIVGYSNTFADLAKYHCILWGPGPMQDLGTLGGTFCNATAINPVGWVVGYSKTPGDRQTVAFRWTGVAMEQLQALGGTYSVANGINSSGDVVGASSASDGEAHAVVWRYSDSYAITDLNDFAPAGSKFVDAMGINDAGQIVAIGYNPGSGLRTFLLTPVGATPVGASVDVGIDATLPDGSTAPVSLQFGSVQAGGQTTVNTSTQGPPPPSGFKLGHPPVYYEVATTAVFSGEVSICFTWTEGQFNNEQTVRVWHLEADVWRDVTSSVDTTNNVACGIVTSLSPFAMMESAYQFSGFFAPVDNAPILNSVKAGQAVPIRFSLGGNFGTNIFAPDSPASVPIGCSTSAPVDDIEQTVTAGGSSLQYDSTKDVYTYVWKTNSAWANSCRALVVKLNDGTQHAASFQFKK